MEARFGLARCVVLLAVSAAFPAAADERRAASDSPSRAFAVAQSPTVGKSKATVEAGAEVRIRIAASPGTNNTIRVTRNQRVRLEIQTGQPAELHLHGYDLVGRSTASNPAVFVFQAVHTGRFAIVTHSHAGKGLLHQQEKPVAYLEVRSE